MFISIGKIVNTHGIKGEVKVMVYSDSLDRFEREEQVYLTPAWLAENRPGRQGDQASRRKLTITGVRYHKNMALLTFAEISDLTQAQGLKGYFLQVLAADLPPLPEGRYYIYQLVGLEVWEKDCCYGKVTEVLQPGSNDVYVVKDGRREILVPALRDVIRQVDLAAGRMEVALPAGLLELYP